MKGRARLWALGFWLGLAGTVGLWYITRPVRTTRKLMAQTIEAMEDMIYLFNDKLDSLRYKLDPTKPGYND